MGIFHKATELYQGWSWTRQRVNVWERLTVGQEPNGGPRKKEG